ncbi:MAG: nucleotide exchange factor GrpE [Candidatus Zhuqueibacterota bacterium]
MAEEVKNSKEKTDPQSKKKPRSKKAIESSSETALKENEVLKTELEELRDKYMRLKAEFENYKKRTERDIGTIIENANKDFCRVLLPVVDDLERSLNSDAGAKKKSFSTLKKGIELVHQKMMAALKSQGVESVDAVGKTFDPEFHEAIMQMEDKDKPSNSVVFEAEKGYVLKGKVIRYSKVVVNK